MEAKEKAKELVNEFRKKLGIPSKHYDKAKQCALICVDEIIKSQYRDLLDMFDEDFANANIDNQSNYWNEVKQEINKL